MITQESINWKQLGIGRILPPGSIPDRKLVAKLYYQRFEGWIITISVWIIIDTNRYFIHNTLNYFVDYAI